MSSHGPEKRAILIVDDNRDDRLVLIRQLRRDKARQYAIEEASSGLEAIEITERFAPDVVILDHHLGQTNGIEVLRALRARGHVETAVVFLTGSDSSSQEPLESGAEDYLSKEDLTAFHLRRALDNALVKARTRAELHRTRLRLESAVAEVTERMTFERRMTAVVSHDLRAPLQSITLGLELLKSETNLSRAGRRCLDRAERSASHMTQMVLQLLDLTRIKETGHFPLDLQQGDIAPVIQDRVDEIAEANPNRPIVYQCEGDGTGYYDLTALGQVVTNLVANAVQHGTDDGAIEVRALCSDDGLKLTVTNQGPAISAQELTTIFEPFVRGMNQSRGLGLGLFIAKEIVRAHAGEISVVSDRDGTTFCIIIPRGNEALSAAASRRPKT